LRQRTDLRYHFFVLDTDEVDAFSHAGGYVYVSRGLFNLVANDIELAWVVGHEIAHVELRHGLGPGPDLAGATTAQGLYRRIAVGHSAEEEYAADAWVTRNLLGLGRSRRECLAFLKRYRDFLGRGLRPAPANDSADPAAGPAPQPFNRHW